MYGGIVSQNGYEKQTFRKFDTVFSGHFHHKSDDGQIYYLGAPYEMYWNDYNCPKGFHIFDTETLELERIINTNTIHEKIYYDDEKINYEEYKVDSFANKFVSESLPIQAAVNLESINGYSTRLLRCLVVKLASTCTSTYPEPFSDLIS